LPTLIPVAQYGSEQDMKKSSRRKVTVAPLTVVETMIKNHGELTPWQIKELKRAVAGMIAGI
jgi:hypothetical protein